MTDHVELNGEQQAMLVGEQGEAKQMAMRLLLDMAAAAGASRLVSIQSAHLSGVSPLTGGLGLRQFLAKLVRDPQARVAVPTTLNAAGCDAAQFEAMHITVPDFLEHSQEIVEMYTGLGVQPTQSCIPYEWEGVVTSGTAAWAESNAICFGNSYCGLLTNRESGLSALACALTGYTPLYGLLQNEARRPNLEVIVDGSLEDPTDLSILGDWIGKQRKPHWQMPFGPIPLVRGLPSDLSHEQRKALTAAAANYGSPLVYVEGISDIPEPINDIQATLHFSETELQRRYQQLRPQKPVSLVVIGCPQASVGEMRALGELVQGKRLAAAPGELPGRPPLWVFTSSANKAIAERTGLAELISLSGALLLENTCPEVVPYDQSWVRHILTNSMKAEHYIKSGLNGIPTSVMPLEACIAVAAGERSIQAHSGATEVDARPGQRTPSIPHSPLRTEERPAQRRERKTRAPSLSFEATGFGLPSQDNFVVVGEAFVTDTPITLLGFVDRSTGVIQEPGHPADGQSLARKIAVFPKGSGSTVAPYVLLELFYRGLAPIAIVNTEIDQQCAPACSLEGIPYAYGFDADIVGEIRSGDRIELRRRGDRVMVRVLDREA